MARTSTSRNGKGEIKIDEQISKIREDIALLAGAVGDAGTSTARDLKDTAVAKRDELARKSMETVDELRSQLSDLEDRVSGTVRQRPMTALGVAAGVGFLLALLLRRQ